MADYNKAGLLVVRNGAVLLCRKKHTTSLLILPGGRVESGESFEQCLDRELREELGDVTVHDLAYVGSYSDRAAGEPDKVVHIELYRGELSGVPAANSEIAELIWFDETDSWDRLAPSLRNHIFPDLIARGFLHWPRSV